ncbi:MAG: MobA/MobL family protein [Desulfosudis oleivorans]|nr:MobA/MobL family protein [Desulfosudis oleivorans]
MANEALKMCGLEPTFDHRSHAARGLTLQPQIHLGPRIAHMTAQGIDTSRGARHAEIDRLNAERSELDARILRRRRTVWDLEQSEAVTLRAQGVWALMRNEQWCAVLEDHPLAGGIDDVRAQATAMVVESDRENWLALDEAFRAEKDVRRFAGAVGPSWESVSTTQGFWAIKPDQDSVVLLRSVFAATDAEDEESLVAMINAALTLPLTKPTLVVKEGVRAMAAEVIQQLGLDWPVLQFKALRLAPR